MVLKVNQKLEIWQPDLPQNRYASRVEEVNLDSLSIAAPLKRWEGKEQLPGDIICGKSIIDFNVYQCTFRYLSKKRDSILMWILSLPEEIINLQLRSFVRLSIALAVHIRIVPLQPIHVAQIGEEKIEEFETTTEDISAGGLRFRCRKFWEVGTEIEGSVFLPAGEKLSFYGEVVRSHYSNTRKMYSISLRFLGLTEVEKKNLMQFIFKKQLEFRNQK